MIYFIEVNGIDIVSDYFEKEGKIHYQICNVGCVKEIGGAQPLTEEQAKKLSNLLHEKGVKQGG